MAEGHADLAAIDAVTWMMIERWDTHAATLRVLARTTPTPALPYITAMGTDSDLIYEGLGEAIAELHSDDRAILGLSGIVRVSPDRYLKVSTPPLGSLEAL